MKLFYILLSTCLLTRGNAASQLYTTRDSLRRLRQADRLLVSTNSSSPTSTTGVICSLADYDTGAQTETYTINFYYALGTTNTSLDAVQTFALQQKLFHAVEQSIAWCYEEQRRVTTVVSNAQNRRMLQQRRLARQLGILTVNVGPTEANIGKFIVDVKDVHRSTAYN
jgi:hypothetical protein